MHSIRLKIRDFEMEATGFDSYEKFEPVLNRAVEIWKDAASTLPLKSSTPLSQNGGNGEQVADIPSDGLDISINSFVVKIGGDSCRSLLKASAGYLVLVKSQPKIKREELLATARESNSWKKNYTDQVAVNIGRMIKQSELIENAKDVYSLPIAIIEEMKSKLYG